MEQLLREQRLNHDSLRIIGAPRRLSLFVDGLAEKQDSLNSEVLGPPKSVAYDEQGNPTKAASGFASNQGVPVEQLEVRETPKGAYVCAVKHVFGRVTTEVLKTHLPDMIRQLSFPKSMRWNDSGLSFARPLRWIVALYGDTVLRFEVGGVKSGNHTQGHRFLGGTKSRRVAVTRPASYESLLKRAGVIVDPQARRTMIASQVEALAKSVKGKVYAEHRDELLEQAVYTVECPQAILGSFDKQFLSLPQEVLMTAMKEHQGYFSLLDRQRKLLPKFITVTNIKLRNMDVIRQGNERVLAARLNDAQYFFREDRKVSLAQRVPQLKGMTFHQKLGSVHQKICRLQELVPYVADVAGHQDVKPLCERAAYLAKADLTTGMVGEFPVLQGAMGREYAIHDQEPTDVCDALGELYLPDTPQAPLPQTLVGMLLAIGDRIDTCTAFFLIGLHPSGSEDPLALRRLAYGLIRILVEKGLRCNLVRLLAQAEHIIQSQNISNAVQEESIVPGVVEFLLERLRFYARTIHGIRDDLVDAVLAARPPEVCDCTDLLSRMLAIRQIAAQPEFEALMSGYKRVHRILQKEQWRESHVDPALFEHDAESQLFRVLLDSQKSLEEKLQEQDYSAALEQVLRLKTPIDAYFEGVMVNAENPQIRANRLSLLGSVNEMFSALADFSRIQPSMPPMPS